MGSRDGDTALWLHNKLGSTDDLWSGRSICSQLTAEKLQDIVQCFRSLQPHVKVKLLLSFLHLVRRNVELWKSDLEEIIELAVNDRDQWVSTVGEILKTYPSTLLVNYSDLSASSTFHSMYTELKKTVKKSSEMNILPLECMCLGKNALSSTVAQTPAVQKHFNIKRKPKSAALRTDLLGKSQDIQSISKKGFPVSNIPMKIRSTAKRMDEEIANTKSPSLGALRNGTSSSSSSSGFLKANTLSTFSLVQRQSSSLAMRKEGGAKMLDISEMPPTGKEAKRRKKMEEQEAAAQAKKEKEEAAAAERAAAAAKATPDYAAGLGGNTAIKTVLPNTQRVSVAVTAPSYLPNVTPRLPSAIQGYTRELASHTIIAQPLVSGTLQTIVSGPVPHSNVNQVQKIRLPSTSHVQPSQTVTIHSVQPSQLQSQQQTSTQQSTTIQPTQQPAQPAKKPLSLTKELMQEAQEMFRNSNKVSRPEKALILGFMAGSRENPCPAQGHIVNIRLSENVETVRLQDNSVREIMIETFFQMNYQTGEWKRIKKPKEQLNVITGLAPAIK